jgi:hypothetical protein
MNKFLHGQCHALAYAMYVKFGYPIYAVADEDNYVDHFVVRRADGNFYDFAGWVDADSFFDRPEMEWAQDFYAVNVTEFFEIVQSTAWEPMKMNEAFEVADLLEREL